MPSEPYIYTNEAVSNQRGETVDRALFRRRRGEPEATTEFRGTGANFLGRRRAVSTRADRTSGRAGRVRNSIRSAAARAAARNPRIRLNR